MAIHDGIFSSRLRKSAGDVTFTVWKGIPVFKKRARNVRNPQSEGQMRQRAKMKGLSALGSLAIVAIRLGFAKFAVGKSEYNVFASKNMAFFTGEPDMSYTVDFSSLQFSQGRLASIVGLSAPTLTDGQLSLTWTAPVVGAPDANDSVVVLALRVNRLPVAQIAENVAKADGIGFVQFPDAEVGDEIQVYAFTRNPDNGEVSDTLYAGEVIA